MFLWLQWWSNVKHLRSAFSRNRTFLWFALCVAGITVRKDLAGVSSILRCCADFLLTVNGRLIILGVGFKAPKAGKKMPAVKKLHQESASNSKPEYIFGHSCQAVALVAGALETFFAIPLSLPTPKLQAPFTVRRG